MLLNMKSPTPLADAIRRELVTKKMNYNIIITGRPQMRKSTTGLSLCLNVDKRFDMTKQMAVIRSDAMLKVLEQKLRRGQARFLDEIGVGMNNREWFSFLNKAMSYTMQTYAHEGTLTVATAPYEDYVDKAARMLFNMLIEMLKKNDKEKYAVAKVTVMEYNQKLNKIYYKFPRGRFPDGTVKRISSFRMKYPADDAMGKYFAISGPIKESLKESLVDEATVLRAKESKRVFKVDDYVDKIEADPSLFIKELYGRRYISREKVMNEFRKEGIGDTRARRIKERAEERLKEKLDLGRKYEREERTDAG